MAKPMYGFDIIIRENRRIMTIEDLAYGEPVPSVTNSIVEVLADIRQETPIPETVIYSDSQGEWDRVIVDKQGRFVRFAPLAANLPERVKDVFMAIDIVARQPFITLH